MALSVTGSRQWFHRAIIAAVMTMIVYVIVDLESRGSGRSSCWTRRMPCWSPYGNRWDWPLARRVIMVSKLNQVR